MSTPCLDLLASAKYKKVAVQSLSEGWGLGGFDNTFGDFLPTAKAAIKKGCKFIRVQMLWSDTHSFGDKDIPKLKKIAAKWEKIAKANPLVRIELSSFCEHNVAKPDKYHDIVAAAAPHCHVVNTPWKGGFSKKYKNEIHGDHKKPSGRYNYSFDGTNCVDSDVEAIKAKYSDAEFFFYWHPRFNLKWSMKDTTPRPKRTAKPTKEVILGVCYLNSPKGNTSLPNKWLCKSWAEKHDAQDKKGDKLLIISPHKSNKIELFTKAGHPIDTLNYYGPFDGGGHRYYSTRMGFTDSELARAQSGTALVQVWQGGKNYGVINPAFRDGYFRD